MTNEDLKKRIEAITQIELLIHFDCGDIVEGGDREICAESIANALITAGIGDVSDLEVKCEVLQRDVDNLTRTLEEGKEELEEANRRAEVAERIAKQACNLIFKDKNNIGGSGITPDMLYRYLREFAEKELAKKEKK